VLASFREPHSFHGVPSIVRWLICIAGILAYRPATACEWDFKWEVQLRPFSATTLPSHPSLYYFIDDDDPTPVQLRFVGNGREVPFRQTRVGDVMRVDVEIDSGLLVAYTKKHGAAVGAYLVTPTIVPHWVVASRQDDRVCFRSTAAVLGRRDRWRVSSDTFCVSGDELRNEPVQLVGLFTDGSQATLVDWEPPNVAVRAIISLIALLTLGLLARPSIASATPE
jgi:hypothetical protein